jgi:gliding motility-associated-like protein
MKTLTVTIIGKPKLKIVFDQDKFCKGDDMGGDITLETNFTAFDWQLFLDENKNKLDTTFTTLNKSIAIEKPGYYHVWAYMDTSLYDTLKDLRIVNNCALAAEMLVADCPLVIPNVITPNGDDLNAVLAIKKLNIERENELTIHDRWGKIVFKQKNYKCLYKGNAYHNIENAFDGLSRGGQKLPDGTYYYSFFYNAIPKKKTYTGIIMILR